MNIRERIYLKSIPDSEGCWIWQGGKKKAGYGTLQVGSRKDGTRKTIMAHRASYAAFKEEMIRIEPKRRALFESTEDDLRKTFDRLGVPEEAGFRFDQPMRVNVLEKT